MAFSPWRSSGRHRTPALALALLLAWAVGLRAWYASEEPHTGRFHDERYSERNLHAALEEGSLRPETYAYPRLSYLPHAVVLATVGSVARLAEPAFSWFDGDRLRPAGVLICRWLQVLFGGVSILLTYLVGRRLFSTGVGLLAAFLVAASHPHLVMSSIFKPDIQLTAAVILAFLCALRAVEQPTAWRYLLAGLTIGLAVATKPTGGLIALPLTAAAVWLGRRDRRHLLYLSLAGATSLIVVLLLNPYVRYLYAFQATRRYYRSEAVRLGSRHDLGDLTRDLVTGTTIGNHGLLIGLVAAAGLLLIVWNLRDGPGGQGRRIGRLMLVGFPPIFLLLYGAAARVVLGQNLLPLVPFTAVTAAVLLVTVWRWVEGRLALLRDPRVGVLAAAVLVLLAARTVHAVAYKTCVPTTAALAFRTLSRAHRAGARAWVRWEGSLPERPPEPGPDRRPPGTLQLWMSPRLGQVPGEVLRRADAEVFRLARMRGPGGEFYRRRVERVDPSQVRILRSRPFHAWGPALVVVRHPWRWLGAGNVDLEPPDLGYRFSNASDRVEMVLDGAKRSVLRNNNLCREIRVPSAAELRLGYGLHRRFLWRSGRRRYAARFAVRSRSLTSGRQVELFADTVALRTPGGGVVRTPWREVAVPLARYGGEAVRLCVATEAVEASSREPTEGLAFWERVEIVDSQGMRHRDRFVHLIPPSTGAPQVASLEFLLQARWNHRPQVFVDDAPMELALKALAKQTIWITDRFPLQNDTTVELRVELPEAIEADRLPVTLHRWSSR